jgi:hypothetical protein
MRLLLARLLQNGLKNAHENVRQQVNIGSICDAIPPGFFSFDGFTTTALAQAVHLASRRGLAVRAGAMPHWLEVFALQTITTDNIALVSFLWPVCLPPSCHRAVHAPPFHTGHSQLTGHAVGAQVRPGCMRNTTRLS